MYPTRASPAGPGSRSEIAPAPHATRWPGAGGVLGDHHSEVLAEARLDGLYGRDRRHRSHTSSSELQAK